MDLTFNSRSYAHVPVYFWPWIWWQLFWLRAYARAQCCDVIYVVAPNGRVVVRLISDNTRDLRSWLYQPREKPHLDAIADTSGERHLSAIHYWMGRIMECGHRVHFVSRCGGEYPAPKIEDSG